MIIVFVSSPSYLFSGRKVMVATRVYVLKVFHSLSTCFVQRKMTRKPMLLNMLHEKKGKKKKDTGRG